MKKSYTLVLNFGYVESSRLTYLPFTSLGKYRDAKVALVDLSAFLKEQYILRHFSKTKACCVKSKEKDSEAKYCSKCSRSLTEKIFNHEAFIDWLVSMDGCDINNFAEEFIEYDESHRWQSNGLEGALNQRFVYQAEWVITAALGYPYREDRTFEYICKERTKEKRESFSYY